MKDKKERIKINYDKLYNDRADLYIDCVIEKIENLIKNIPNNNKVLKDKLSDELLKSYIQLEKILEDV